jgi:hypothetical protein
MMCGDGLAVCGWRSGATRMARSVGSGKCSFGVLLLVCRGGGPGLGATVLGYRQMILCNLGCDSLGCAVLRLTCERWMSGRQPRKVVMMGCAGVAAPV